ncbi:helix-turn-helix domain-containing protein [Devosia sp. 63-57]|uniref:helix-turn-helix domain-containing protein n=1 Tax=Devosia sp. 63-57 TaxID=1895751 RepID=UPI00086ECC4E|nr:helix-turn-helix domain-containing protein [Devosia sp. 63-57]ODT48334.1 MAG: transcriptional regulator [Pelagibacterium sp. SCN 63-126]ODU88829.1 MAG: transcriptional regulator [Pelagibacterium sp. SCN 63-17]OJX43728.1 MAG: transcriptional regulator [Devosia sp. 63-57]
MFDTALRDWRSRRGMSQMALAMAAEVSPRHLSFLETARARPSAAMVLRLAEALGLPLRERNALLVAAGFAPQFGDSDWLSPSMAELRRAALLLLGAHMPYPAIVLDGAFWILEANAPALALIGASETTPRQYNLADLVCQPGPTRESILNWPEVAGYLVHRLREAVRRHGPASEPAKVLARVLRQEDAAALVHAHESQRHLALLPLEFRIEGAVTRWFTTVTSFGGPQDALAEEITIEQFHPAV